MAMRANSLTTENKRRTLQRNDIAMAVSKTDTYDFLIDIVPRDEVRFNTPPLSPPQIISPQQLVTKNVLFILGTVFYYWRYIWIGIQV